MIKLINIITQIIIVLGCCAMLIFTLSNANYLFLYCKDTAILSFTLLLLNHTLQSVKIVVFLNRLLT